MKIIEADEIMWVTYSDEVPDTHDVLGYGGHEKPLINWVAQLLVNEHRCSGTGGEPLEGAVILDVGAHVGAWTLRLAKMGARVVAIEASRDSFTVLKENLSLNPQLSKRVRAFNFAAWNEYATLQGTGGRPCDGSKKLFPSVPSLERPEWIEGFPLDDIPYINSLPKIDFVKIDIEGSELNAIKGMRKTLHRFRPLLFIERHDRLGYYNITELYALLDNLNYNYKGQRPPNYMTAEYLLARPYPIITGGVDNRV